MQNDTMPTQPLVELVQEPSTLKVERLSCLCSAIGDSSGNSIRARTLVALHDHGAQDVGNLAGLLNVAQSALSGHLKILTAAGLVTSRREGSSKIFTVQLDTINDLVNTITNLFVFKGEQPANGDL